MSAQGTEPVSFPGFHRTPEASLSTAARGVLIGAALMLTAAMAAAVAAVVGSPPAAAGAPALPGDAMVLFTDPTGASGQPWAVWLNPAAAAALKGPSLTVQVVARPSDRASGSTVYAASLLDPGGPLAGGLTGSLQELPEGRTLRVSYSVAAAVPYGALGVRATWIRFEPSSGAPGTAWTGDVGFIARLGARVRIGGALYDLSTGGSRSTPLFVAGRAGLALSLPVLAAAPSQGLLVSAAVADPDIRTGGGQTIEAGLEVPLQEWLHLGFAYEHALDPDGSHRWGTGLVAGPKRLRLYAGYQSDGVYQAGLSTAF